MTTKYCYISHCGSIAITDRVFFVFVGDSLRERNLLARIDSECARRNAFFRKYDADTMFYLKQNAKRFVSDTEEIFPFFETFHISAFDFYHHLIDNSLDIMEQPRNVLHNRFVMASVLSPKFFFNHSNRPLYRSATTVSRKNLSPEKQIERVRVGVSFLVILAIFLLGAVLEGIERTLY